MSCSMDKTHYITPTILNTTVKRNKMAACSLTNLYGSVSPRRLVEWFEIHRYLGVDMFTLHPYPSLNSLARKVLSFYEKEGLAEVFELVNPKETGPRGTTVAQYQNEQFTAEHIGCLDCRERHKYYEVAAEFDIDELFLTADLKKNALKSILGDRFRSGNVAILSFYNYVHMLTWKPSNATHPVIFGRYEDATEPFLDTTKNMYMATRVQLSKGSMHDFFPQPGFTRKFVDPNVAAIHHFRACKPEWSKDLSRKFYRDGKLKSKRMSCDIYPRKRFEQIRHFLNLKVIHDNIINVCSVLKLCE